MKRQTSIDCYNQIKEEGLLSKLRLQVYEALLHSAPCTSSEAMAGRLNSTNVLSQSRARFTELRELGVIYEKGERKCNITGRNVIEWDLTDKLPQGKISNNKKKLPKALQDYADWFKGINNVMNKDNAQYMVDMYWNNKH